MSMTLKMDENEMMNFIRRVGRSELFSELENFYDGSKYPDYFKAVKVTLIELGYNEEWVESTFETAMINYYHEVYDDYKKYDEEIDAYIAEMEG